MQPSEVSEQEHHRGLDWRLIARGSLIGFACLVPVVGLIAILRHVVDGFTDSGAESAVALLALVCYFVGGYNAVGSQQTSLPSAGALAGAGVSFLGRLGSLAVWAIRGGSYLTGNQAEHPTKVIVGPLVTGALVGAIGAWWAGRQRGLANA